MKTAKRFLSILLALALGIALLAPAAAAEPDPHMPVIIVEIPRVVTTWAGGAFSFTMYAQTAEEDVALTYEWYENGVFLTSGQDILVPFDLQGSIVSGEQREYYCIVTSYWDDGQAGPMSLSAQSDTITVTFRATILDQARLLFRSLPGSGQTFFDSAFSNARGLLYVIFVGPLSLLSGALSFIFMPLQILIAVLLVVAFFVWAIVTGQEIHMPGTRPED